MMDNVLLDIDKRGVARLTLNRPDVHNAFDDVLIGNLISKLVELEENKQVRVVVIAANGKSFSAGGDLNWMARTADYSHAENMADARELADLMRKLNFLSRPTVALVQGAAYGGGVGLSACCDIVIASERATFCLSEVKLGLIASVISPYVRAAIGESQARRYTLSAEVFNAEEAKRIGLVHEVVATEDLEAKGEELVCQLLKNSPAAMAGVKDLLFYQNGLGIDDDLVEETAVRIANVRASSEGKEGVSAFLEKRAPSWIKDVQ
ncbi:MAG: enoyl-CoA hydratase/isomerase family protein [Rhodospirillaceae bacterium]|nr:enoyl-CoA hydratase/isomerase family protein [Rhodospirillaceae bacterium]MBL6941692.1 enoyl-CoA hydratase/isomerase family protein [Rhodospirillales bacterium]